MSFNFSSSQQNGLSHCGCCQGTSLGTPVVIDNRPGLSGIAYRVGTHALFKQSMQAMLSSSKYSALEGLTTREDEDFSVALLDAWATVADVLTFYQERIANESFLRTATERFSIRQLARLTGYELSPGVAANAYLAFTMDESVKLPEAITQNYPTITTASQGYQTPDRVTVTVGTKVQSIPGQDELPQTFETIQEIEARAQWNALRPRLTQPQTVNFSTNTIYLKGTALNLKAGDKILIVLNIGATTKAGYRIITKVTADSNLNHTQIELLPIEPIQMIKAETSAFSAFSTNTLTSNNGPSKITKGNYYTLTGASEEMNLRASGSMTNVFGEGLISNIDQSATYQFVASTGKVHVLREQAGFFGNNAPYYSSLIGADGHPQYTNFEDWQIWQCPAVPSDSKVLLKNLEYISTSKASNAVESHEDADVYLERTIPGVLPDSWALFVNSKGNYGIYRIDKVNEKSLVGFGISAKGTGLTLAAMGGGALEDKPSGFKMRNTTAYLKSELLELADMPFQNAKLDAGNSEITLGEMVIGLGIGQPVALQGKLKEQPGVRNSEILFIEKITHEYGFTKLKFRQGLAASYEYDTVTLNANVAPATHGETVMEVLGSGDGVRANQQFKLRQPPLTHVSAAESGGSESTLQVRVNDLLWEEVPDFYGRGPDERIYVTRTNEDGTTTLQFGDGEAGARLPTGRENVRAQYRKGLGTGGNVKAGQLSQLMSRPLGLKHAFNPLAANGGDDPETLDNARMNAPINVLTLGRVVSLQDYEDFARTFAGVAKALATWTWNGTRRVVAVTVAGPKGADIKPDQATYTNLLRAMQGAGDPHVNLQVISYGRAFFRIAGTVWCGREYLPEKVQPALKQALQAQFGFEARGFGQPVRLSEVVAVIQGVSGVEAVDTDRFYRADQASGWNARLPAAMPHLSVDGDLAPAELLLLDTDALSALVVTKVGKKGSVRHSFRRGNSSLKITRNRLTPHEL